MVLPDMMMIIDMESENMIMLLLAPKVLKGSGMMHIDQILSKKSIIDALLENIPEVRYIVNIKFPTLPFQVRKNEYFLVNY